MYYNRDYSVEWILKFYWVGPGNWSGHHWQSRNHYGNNWWLIRSFDWRCQHLPRPSKLWKFDEHPSLVTKTLMPFGANFPYISTLKVLIAKSVVWKSISWSITKVYGTVWTTKSRWWLLRNSNPYFIVKPRSFTTDEIVSKAIFHAIVASPTELQKKENTTLSLKPTVV